MKNTLKIDRLSDNENTSAIISFDYETILSVEDSLSLITKSISSWIKNTKEGMDSWIYSANDFNIGDLSNYVSDKNLIIEFSKNGITNLEINDNEFLNSKYIWNFDTVLVDESLL